MQPLEEGTHPFSEAECLPKIIFIRNCSAVYYKIPVHNLLHTSLLLLTPPPKLGPQNFHSYQLLQHLCYTYLHPLETDGIV